MRTGVWTFAIFDVVVMLLYMFVKPSTRFIKDFLSYYAMMSLASSAYLFLMYLAEDRVQDACVLCTFTIMILLLIETRRGPIYLLKYDVKSEILIGTRKSSLESAELPLTILFLVMASNMLLFSPDLISVNVFAVVLSTTITIMYLLQDDEIERLVSYSMSEENRCRECDIQTQSNHTKHCYVCKQCIVRFDHHCVWLGTCIGAGNHVSFLLLLMFVVFHGVYFLTKVYYNSSSTILPSLGAAIHVTMCTIAVLVLLLVQFYQVIILGLTTYERIKRVRYTSSRRISKQDLPRPLRVVLVSLPRNLQRFLLTEYQNTTS